MDSLDKAKQELREGWTQPNGVQCKCCGQKVKLYRRPINANQAAALTSLVGLYLQDRKYHHVSELTRLNLIVSDFAQLRRWGLIMELHDTDGKKRNSGWWMPTQQGIDFVHGSESVFKYCEIYNNKTVGFSDETTTIHEALGAKFDYQSLMRGQAA
jgi:hypothetical protein